MLIATTYSTSPTATAATATVDTVTGVVDPEFQVSKKYPTVGYITSPANLTIDVIPPLTVNETFMGLLGHIRDTLSDCCKWDGGCAYDIFCRTSEKQKGTQIDRNPFRHLVLLVLLLHYNCRLIVSVRSRRQKLLAPLAFGIGLI